MPRIPVYQSQVNIPQSAKVIQPDFSGIKPDFAAINASNAAVSKYGETVGKLGLLLAERASEQQQMEDNSKVEERENLFRKDVEKFLYDPELNDKKIPKGIMARQLSQANGAEIDYSEGISKLKSKYLELSENDYQRNKLFRKLDDHDAQYSNLVYKHVANEKNKNYNKTTDDSLELQIKSAAIIQDYSPDVNKPGSLVNAISNAIKTSENRDRYFGLSNESITSNNYKVGYEMTKSAISGSVDTNSQLAKRLLESAKKNNMLSESDYKSLDNLILGKSIQERSDIIWNQVKSINLSDRTPDVGTRLKTVEKVLAGQPAEIIERVKNEIKGKSSEQLSELHARERANENTFVNLVLKNKLDGKPADASMKYAATFGADLRDQEDKKEIIRKIYSTPTASNPFAFIPLWEGVRTGTVNRETIDSALRSDNPAQRINVNEWETLRKDLFNQQQNGENQVEKSAMERINIMADQTYGYNNVKKKIFLYEVKQFAKDAKTVGEWVSIADSLMKVDKDAGAFSNKTVASEAYRKQEEQLKAIYAPATASNLAINTIKTDVGEDIYNGLSTYYANNRKRFDPQEFERYSYELGGFDKVKFGTPANNAIRALISKGTVPPTVANVKAILEKYPAFGLSEEEQKQIVQEMKKDKVISKQQSIGISKDIK